MPISENQNVTDFRSQLAERLNKRFPDRKYIGQEGQDGQEALDDMNQSALEWFDEYEAKTQEYESYNQKLLDLMYQDKTAAEFVNKWASTGDPVKAMVSIFGSEKFRSALESEEGLKSIEEGEKEYLKGITENEESAAKRDTEFVKSLETLDAFGNAKGLDADGKLEIMQKLLGLANAALDGKFTEADFQMAYNAIHHDTDVQSARQQGTLDGRNERIREIRRQKAQSQTTLPTLGGQSAPMTRPQVSKKVSDGDRFALD